MVGGLLLFELVSGLLMFLAPFNEFTQFSALLHSLIGIAMLAPVIWYLARHWWLRKKGLFNHFKLLGYIALAILILCLVAGLVLTWEGLFGLRISYGWSQVHLVTGVGVALLVVAHMVIVSLILQACTAGRPLTPRQGR